MINAGETESVSFIHPSNETPGRYEQAGYSYQRLTVYDFKTFTKQF